MISSKRRHFAFLFALPALFVLVLLKVVPLVIGLVLAFKDYSVVKGVLASPWVGGANFGKLLGSPAFWQVLKNTLVINTNFILATCALALILGIFLSYIKNTRLFLIFCVFFILPFFIPQVYWNVLLVKMFSTQGWIQGSAAKPRFYLAEGEVVRFLYIAIEVIRWTGLLAALIAFAVRRVLWHGRIIAAFKAVFSIFLVSIAFILVTDFELLHLLVNPLVYEKVDTLSLYQFRTGIMSTDVGVASVLWFLKFLYCFVILAFLLVVAGGFIKNSLMPISSPTFAPEQTGQEGANAAAVIIATLYSIFTVFILFLMVFAFFGTERLVSMPFFLPNGIIYGLLALVSSAVGILLSILLAYPLTTGSPAARKIYAVIFILLLAAGQFNMHEYLFIRSLGLINTYFAILAASLFNPVVVLILGAFYNQKSSNTPASFGQYVKTSLPVIIFLFIAVFLLNADAYTSSLMYIARPDMQAPSVQIYMGITQAR